MYQNIEKGYKYKLYKYKEIMPFGIIYKSSNKLKEYDYGFYLHNQIYQSLFDRKDELITIKTFYNDSNDKCFNINETLSEEDYVYLDLTYNESDIDYISINNTYHYNIEHYIKYLGIYDNDIDIKICSKEDKNIDGIDLGTINVNKYKELINSINQNVTVNYNNGYKIYAYSETDDNSLFLPINNIKGYKITLNNQNIKADKYLDNFISIKLSKGDNNIIIKYHEPYLLVSIILSIISILLLLFSKYININNKYILNVAYYLYIILGLSMYLYFYVYSFIK